MPTDNSYTDAHSSIFITAKNWKQPERSLAGERTNQFWCIWTTNMIWPPKECSTDRPARGSWNISGQVKTSDTDMHVPWAPLARASAADEHAETDGRGQLTYNWSNGGQGRRQVSWREVSSWDNATCSELDGEQGVHNSMNKLQAAELC